MNGESKMAGQAAELHLEKGQLAYQQEEWREAIEHYRKGFEICLGKREAFKDVGNALSEPGDKKGAFDACHREINIDRKNLQAYINFGFVLTKADEQKEAAEVFRRAIEIDSSDSEMFFGLGAALNKMGDSDGAIENYRKAIELDPLYALAYFHLGEAF